LNETGQRFIESVLEDDQERWHRGTLFLQLNWDWMSKISFSTTEDRLRFLYYKWLARNGRASRLIQTTS
jgi:hypothetical protein